MTLNEFDVVAIAGALGMSAETMMGIKRTPGASGLLPHFRPALTGGG
jgi:hypothetical protein